MPKKFLEALYRDAGIYSELKRALQYSRLGDSFNYDLCMKRGIFSDLTDICQKYKNIDEKKGVVLNECLQVMKESERDMIRVSDIIEGRLLPVLEEYLKTYQMEDIVKDDEEFSVESTISGFLTIRDKTTDAYYHSIIDPMDEARKQAEFIYIPQKKVVCLLGCGLGYLAYQIYCISDGSVDIKLYEAKQKIIEYAYDYGVLDWIPRERLQVTVMTDIMQFLYNALDENIHYYLFPQELYFQATPEELPILDGLGVSENTRMWYRRVSEINFWRNLQNCHKRISEIDFSSLKKDFIVVAAGPSLDDNLDFLRSQQGKKTIIAVGTVFKKLLQKGIRPDYVTILDPTELTLEQTEGVWHETVPLLIASTAYWKHAALYQGDKYLIFENNALPWTEEYAEKYGQEIWDCGGTVTSLAIEIAIRFGAEAVYLVGVDLAYPGGFTHAEDISKREKVISSITVESVNGEQIYSDVAMLGFLGQIEERIAQAERICFYNMSRIGARIKGIVEVIFSGS